MKHKSPSSGSSSTQDARIVKTDAALRRALLGLLERKPLDQITIREIAAEAGIHYTTFFRRHPTKEALLDDVAADQIDQLVKLAVPVQDAVNTHAAFVALCAYVNEHRPLWTALLTGGAAGTLREEFINVSREIARHRVSRLSWIPAELSVICSVTVIIETLAWWLKQPADSVSVDQLAKMLDCLIPTATSAPKESQVINASTKRRH